MNKTITTLALVASVSLSPGCSAKDSSNNNPHLTFEKNIPTAVTYGSNRVNFTLCTADPQVLKLSNDTIKNSGAIGIPKVSKVCMNNLNDTVEAIVMKTREGWVLVLRNTGNPTIDGSYKFE